MNDLFRITQHNLCYEQVGRRPLFGPFWVEIWDMSTYQILGFHSRSNDMTDHPKRSDCGLQRGAQVSGSTVVMSVFNHILARIPGSRVPEITDPAHALIMFRTGVNLVIWQPNL